MKIVDFIDETDRKKKQVLAKQISNICSKNFKLITAWNAEAGNIIYPLIALGYFKVNDKTFDPDTKKLIKIMEKLKKFLK